MVIWNTLRVGFFLAIRSLKRSNRYVTVLIIIILTLIFLNLVAIGGLLLGLIRGSEIGWIKTYGGAVVIEPPAGEKFVEDPNDIIDFTKTIPGYVSYSPRLDEGGKLETGYKEKKVGSEVSNISAVITGVDPELEGKTVAYPSFLYSGRFLENGDRDKIVLGSLAAGKGATIGFGEALEDVHVGDKILATYGNGVQREYELVGIIESKEPEINLKAFVTLDELQDVMNYTSPRYTDIHVMIENPLVEAFAFKDYYVRAGYTKDNTVEIWSEAIGTAVDDVNDTMQALGDIIGGIGLMVGGITIFILIFVNAVSKRRFIGILKASGINTGSIILSYVFQGLWYTMIAIGIGLIILYGFLVPYIDRNPIDFPFADGILYVPWDYVFARLLVLVAVSMVSGFVPAYLIARENTLNAILGR